MSQAYELVPIERVVESPLNPRRHYNEKRLGELAESIRQAGIISPLIVRGRDANYEIAAGHRRRRAALLAGLTEVPVIIRPMDDATFLEILNIENLQREDIHPLEEADGFARLLELPSYSTATLADRVGKSESYVQKRLALRGLIEPLRKLFVEERINISHAILLARLQAADQESLSKLDDRDPGPLWEDDWNNGRDNAWRPLPPAELARVIEAQVYLDLKGTPWNKADAELVPAAGACMTCPKRTKANLALFDDVEKGDRCLDRACYESKRDAHLVQVQAKLQAKGAELPKISLGHHGGEVPKGVKQVHSYEVRDKGDKDDRPTEKALVVAGPRRGEVVEVFVRTERGLNLDDPAERRKREAAEAKAKLDKKAEWEGRKLAWRKAFQVSPTSIDRQLTVELIALLAERGKAALCDALYLKREEGESHADAIERWAKSPGLQHGQLTSVLLGIVISPLLEEHLWSGGEAFEDILSHLGVSIDDCIKEARKQLAQKAGHKGEAPKATKKPAKAAKKKGKK